MRLSRAALRGASDGLKAMDAKNTLTAADRGVVEAAFAAGVAKLADEAQAIRRSACPRIQKASCRRASTMWLLGTSIKAPSR
jgi:hypothetical protein